MKRLLINVGLILIFFVAVSFAEDSPLVKAAKREKARRAKVKSDKTFTNKDIEDFKAKNKDTEAVVEGENQGEEQTGEQTEAEPAEGETTQPQAEEDKGNDEKYWKDRYTDVAEDLKQAEDKLQNLQEEMNGLRIAYYAEQDGVAGRPKINSEIEKQFDEIEAAKKQVEDSKQALENLEEEARKAGVPPGWVRE
jgi:chromosome segregation ATPase